MRFVLPGLPTFASLFLHRNRGDAWLGLFKAAHWHADIEQVVRTGEDAFHRVDIAAAAPHGTLWALDVSITATPGPEGTVILNAVPMPTHLAIAQEGAADFLRVTPLSPSFIVPIWDGST